MSRLLKHVLVSSSCIFSTYVLFKSHHVYAEQFTPKDSISLEVEWTKLKRSQGQDDLKLLSSQVYIRHGARTPLHKLPDVKEVKLNY